MLQKAGVTLARWNSFFILPMMPGAGIMVRLSDQSNRRTEKKIIVDWNYNAWGNKYPPYDLDDVIPTLIGKAFGHAGLLSRNHHGRRFG